MTAPDASTAESSTATCRAKVARRFAAAFSAAAAAAAAAAGEAGAADADAGAAADPAELGRHLEICAWNWCVRTCRRDKIPLYWQDKRFRYRYTTRALALEQNLRNPRNPSLAARLLRKSLGLKAFAAMRPPEMWPELWEPVYQRAAARQLRREAGITRASDAPDGAYECRRCKSRKTVYTTMQIRSADEPETVYVHCLNCGKNWKD